jgi:regulator of replication initiation timing
MAGEEAALKSDQANDELQEEITRLLDDNVCVRVEVDRLRAELAAARSCAYGSGEVADRFAKAALKDAEEIARLRSELHIADVHDVSRAREAERQAEEIVRLREELKPLRAENEKLRSEITQLRPQVDEWRERCLGIGANRYWEGRWRSEAKENAALLDKLNARVACQRDTDNCVMDERCNETNCRYVAMEIARRCDAEEIARFREALMPFADAYKDLLENWGRRDDFVLVSLARAHRDVRITIADFGRAHAAISPHSEGKDG